MRKNELQRRFKEIETQLNILTARREKHTKLIKSMNVELGRINDKIDDLSREIISVVEAIRKISN